MNPEKTGSRTALITGAAGGIGQAIANELAHAGHPVILVDKSAQVHDVALHLERQGLRAQGVVMDITNEDAVNTLPQQTAQLWETLGIVINNAGISPKFQGKKRDVIDMPLDEWQHVLTVNLTGTFLITRLSLAQLTARCWGRIVMITSQAARTRTLVPGAHYSATKAGMAGFARILAGEVARHGITVNCVAPGRVQSAMTAAVASDVNARISDTVPVGRMGLPEEVAAAVAYLVSERAGFTTGATIDVNGGGFMA